MSASSLRVAIIGMGGFAQEHHRVCRVLEEQGLCQVVAACDPRMDTFADAATALDFAGRGVRTFTDYLTLLDACQTELDVVTVPTPVPLHASMHRACVEHGLACYLEKPPTLNYAELDEMLAVEAKAAYATQVGFNFIVEEPRQALKRRLLDGEFGAVKRVCFQGLWPRPTTYFTRASWAARLLLDGKLVLDSCSGNAMAHYLHNVHFWCGQKDVFDWEEVVSAEAELYRAHAIEGMDTVFARGLCANGIAVQIALSHACDGTQRHREWIECEEATIVYVTRQEYQIAWKDGREETGPTDRRDLLVENFKSYFAYLRGETFRPPTSLSDSIPFVHFNNLTYLAARHITTVPDAFITRTPVPNDSGETVAIQGIEEACSVFFDKGLLPGEQGLPWAKSGGLATLADLPHLEAVIGNMADERGRSWKPI